MFRKDQWSGTRELKVDLGLYFGLESHDDAHVTLREMTVAEGVGLKGTQGIDARYEYIKKLLPGIVVEHDFYDGETPMKTEEVATLVGDNWSALNAIAELYWTFSFFIQNPTTRKG